MTLDVDNPMSAPSLYLDDLKRAGVRRGVKVVDSDGLTVEYEMLLRDAELPLDAAAIAGSIDFFAQSFSRATGIHPFLTGSIFSDGVMHGIALAAGLKPAGETA